jgi:4-amino-4-deoxy-L-arabinose transferase-like glycosyltransferase
MQHYMAQFFKFTKEAASLNMTVVYLGFVFAVIGLANSSRNRWEDLKLQAPKPPEERRVRAIRQASRDFHNWYGSIIFVTNIGEVICLLAWAGMLLTKDDTRKVLPLLIVTVAVVGGHFFSWSTYKLETTQVLEQTKRYGPFFPLKFFTAQQPGEDKDHDGLEEAAK